MKILPTLGLIVLSAAFPTAQDEAEKTRNIIAAYQQMYEVAAQNPDIDKEKLAQLNPSNVLQADDSSAPEEKSSKGILGMMMLQNLIMSGGMGMMNPMFNPMMWW